MQLPSNLTQLIGWVVACVSSAIAFYKTWVYVVGQWSEVQKAKYTSQLESTKANTLSAERVADFISKMATVQQELERMKHDDTIQTDNFVKSITRIEEILDTLNGQFTEFLMKSAFSK